MELIGAGLPRTATLSQKVAVEMLGLRPCYHMVKVLGDLSRVSQWRRALDGDADWAEIFGDCRATVDWPGSFFYPELVQAFPEAKVLLSVRDSEAWARSMRQTIWGARYGDSVMSHLSAARGQVDAQWRGYIELMQEMWQRSGLLDGEDTSDDAMAAGMRRYDEEVQRTVPAHRLLVWSATDGWEPLCAFLGLPQPEAPFPRLNDSAEFARRIIDGSLLTLQQWRTHDAEEAGVASSRAADG